MRAVGVSDAGAPVLGHLHHHDLAWGACEKQTKARRIVLTLLCSALLVGCWQVLVARRVRASDHQTVTPHFRRMVAYHERSVEIVPKEAVVFIGDSIMQGLCVAAVSPKAVNYGIGGDTTAGVLHRLETYRPALDRASAVVIAIGVNDLLVRRNQDILSSHARILGSLPGVPVVISSVLPVDESMSRDRLGWNKRIVDLNHSLKRLALTDVRFEFVDNQSTFDRDSDGTLDAQCHIGDGLHLNSFGNGMWASNLRAALPLGRVD